MARDRGKEFENKFRQDWMKSFPDSFLLRLPDQVTGYKTYSRNICDFIAFTHKKLFLIECKSCKGASIPISNITQYDLMIKYKDKDDIVCGVVIWLYEKDVVMFVPISEVEKIINDGKKSIGISILDKYKIKVLYSVKKRVFMDTDYTDLLNLE